MGRWPAYAELANFPAELVVKHPQFGKVVVAL